MNHRNPEALVEILTIWAWIKHHTQSDKVRILADESFDRWSSKYERNSDDE